MKRVLKALLTKLSAIQEAHDGLGDTNVRDHMGDHVRRAFLKPERGYVPQGEYGLDPKADRRVAAALTAFCKAATAYARTHGLKTYAQRVAAFQDRTVTTASGVIFEDFFGVIELKPPDGKAGAKKTSSKPPPHGRRAVRFDWDGSLDDLCQALNAAGTWPWFMIRQYRVPFAEAHIGDFLWARLRVARAPGRGFEAVLEAQEGTKKPVKELVTAFRATLKKIAARGVKESNSPLW